MAIERETPWGYLAIPSYLRERLDKEAPKLTSEVLIQELMNSCETAVWALEGVLQCKGKTDTDLELSPISAREMYSYAFEGSPYFLKPGLHEKQISKGEAVSTMLWHLDNCLLLNELPTAFEATESTESPGLIATINAVAARCRLDHHRLTGDEWWLSIQEVALLARMRELSVRNAASPKSPTPLKTTKTEEGLTMVDTSEANRWLSKRRRYVATALPSDSVEKEAMIAAIEEWAL
ncbi:hypothetical protein QQM79_03715 [Marinobacteraceae bacterium S3BR75-40.1]